MELSTPRVGTRLRNYLLPSPVRHLAPIIAKWTFVAILVRVLLAPITASRDLSVTAWVSLVLLDKHQLIQSNDPPIVFLFFSAIFGALGPLISPQMRSFYLSSRNYNPSEVMHILALAQPGIQQMLLVMKLPFLFFDIGIGLMILHLIEDPKKALLGYKLWLFNPVSILVSYVIGQYDIMVTFFIVLSLFLYKKRKENSTALALGMAAAIKAVGLLLLLPFALFRIRQNSALSPTKKAVKFIQTILLGLLPPILGVLPLQLFAPYYESANLAMPPIYVNGFYGLTLWNRGSIGSNLFVGIETFVLGYSISVQTGAGWDVFFLLPLMYMGLLVVLVHFRGWSFDTMRDSFLIFLLAYYALDTFHAQWFLWVQPLLILVLVSYYDKLRNVYWASCGLFFTYLLNFGSFLTVGLFVPIYPPAMEFNLSLPAIVTLSLRMILSVVLLYMALLIFLERWGHRLPWRIGPKTRLAEVNPALG